MTTHTATPPPEMPAPRRDRPPRSPVRNFVRHYAEMVVAMFLGMFALWFALTAPLELAGVDVSGWDADAPALLLLGMAFAMTAPMVAWMRYRRRAWARAWEMAAAMFVPTFVLVGLLWAGAQTDVDALLELQHLVMFPSMLAVMLLRRHAYTGDD